MSAHITVIDGNTLRILELVGDNASEVARISLRDTRASTVTTIVANLLPFLAPAGLDKIHRNGSAPEPSAGRAYLTRDEKVPRIEAFVAAHPDGVTFKDIQADLGLKGNQAQQLRALIQEEIPSLRLEKIPGQGTGTWMIYPGGAPVPAGPPPGTAAERKERLYAYIAEHPGTSGADALRALGYHPQSVARTSLTELAHEGRVRKEGVRNGTTWYVA